MTEHEGLVAIVDDEQPVCRSLQRLLAANGYSVETFGTAEAFLASTPPPPACVVLDVRLPGLDGMALQTMLAERGDALPIVFISGHADIPMSVRAMKKGAVDFLPKPVQESDLIPAVEAALERSRQESGRQTEQKRLRRLAARLSPREREVLDLVVEGLLNKQIAARLGIAEKTVKLHRGHLTQKLGLRAVADLVRFCQTAALEPLPERGPRPS
jgi:FixJ family two-component response regulator